MHLNISPEIATALYSGLSSDTYSFVNANTNISSFEAGKLLFEKGADIRKANVTLYQTLTKPQFEMKKYLYKNLEIIDDEIAIITIPYKDMVNVGACKQDCENHSSEMASIQGVNISCSIIERQPNKINCSFRSRDGYNVSLIAQRLGGGGHVHAAGCRLEIENLKEAKDLVLDAIRKYLKSREN